MLWEALTIEEINTEIHTALRTNLQYDSHRIMGFPGSFLDRKIFPKRKTPKTSAYWLALWDNPNHIGCHTFGSSTPEFSGTQKIEKDLLRICAEEILGADQGSWDGYVSTGGTEANIQAMWMFRNRWINDQIGNHVVTGENYRNSMLKHMNEIQVLCSEDTHYSIYKGANILNIHLERIPVDELTRQMNLFSLAQYIEEARKTSVKKFLIVLNMGSTHFGSVDDIDTISEILENKGVDYAFHVDAAFGGFIYPFTNPNNKLNFSNQKIVSFTMDAHKMLQAPYGTGIFLTRKNTINTVQTKVASYIPGDDCTVCGSRSGANAISIWMILMAYGSKKGTVFCNRLCKRTGFLCEQLKELKIRYFREPYMNIVAIDARDMPQSVSEKYHLVADTYHNTPAWWKVVVMDHVNKAMITEFVKDLKSSKEECHE